MKGLSLLVMKEAWVEAKAPQGDPPPVAAGRVSLLCLSPSPILGKKGTVSLTSAYLSWSWVLSEHSLQEHSTAPSVISPDPPPASLFLATKSEGGPGPSPGVCPTGGTALPSEEGV